jgi:hypothetical protein
MKADTVRRIGTLLILAAALGGCAAIERQDAAGTEKLLAAAGFRAIPADSAERRRDLATLPPREVVIRHRGARTVYVYADARNCRCLYVGGPNDYAKYLQLKVSEDIAGDTSAGSRDSVSASFPVPASWEPQWEPDDWQWAPDDPQWAPDVWVPGD